MSDQGNVWTVVMAAGEGARAARLSASLPRSRPEQYWVMDGDTTLLRRSIDRALAIVPRERVVLLVAEAHRELWWREVGLLPAENVVVQPRDRGTAAAILLPLLHVLRRDPSARVVVMPCDHQVDHEGVLVQALRDALQAPALDCKQLLLLATIPASAQPEHGWVVPSPLSPAAVRDVGSVIANPDATTARDLMRLGALANMLLYVSDASVVVDLYKRRLPELLRLLSAAQGGTAAQTAAAYERLPVPNADFLGAVLERSASHLAVFSVPVCGWRAPEQPRTALNRGTPWADRPASRRLVLPTNQQPVCVIA